MAIISFYNNTHNGDLHVSREFVKDIITKLPNNEYYYVQSNSPKLLLDLNATPIIKYNGHEFADTYYEDGNLFINTWYMSNLANYNRYGCTLQTLYENFRPVYNILSLKLEPIEYYIPEIDFSKFHIKNVDDYFKWCRYDKRIFMSNGLVRSGQMENYDMDPLIEQLADAHTDCLFIASNDTVVSKQNVIKSTDIIRLESDDLNENAYVSTFCDVIFGRMSGAQSFTLIKDNFTTEGKRVYVVNTSYREYDFGLSEYMHKDKTIIKIENSALKDIFDKLIIIVSGI